MPTEKLVLQEILTILARCKPHHSVLEFERRWKCSNQSSKPV